MQGLAGGVGIVIAQAAGRDIYTGGALIRFYGRLTVVGGFAAIVGPLLGGMLNTVTDWRGLFVFLAAIGAGILVVTLLVFRETLPDRAAARAADSRTTLRDFRTLLVRPGVRRRRAQPGVPVRGPVRLPRRRHLRAAGHLRTLPARLRARVRAQLGRLHGLRIPRRRAPPNGGASAAPSSVGILVAGLGRCGLLVSGLTPMPLWVVIVSLFLLASGVAISSPPATTLALVDYPQIAGTASSLLGMVRFGFGGIAAPLVGVAGALSILPLGVVTTVAVAPRRRGLPAPRSADPPPSAPPGDDPRTRHLQNLSK